MSPVKNTNLVARADSKEEEWVAGAWGWEEDFHHMSFCSVNVLFGS